MKHEKSFARRKYSNYWDVNQGKDIQRYTDTMSLIMRRATDYPEMNLYFTKIIPESGEKNTSEFVDWSNSHYIDGIYNVQKDHCDVDNELTIVTMGSKVHIFYLCQQEADSYYAEEDDADRFYINRDYQDSKFKLMRFKFK